MATARGDGGQVRFNGREVVIDRAGTASFIIHGLTGLRRLSVHDIQSVRLRRVRGRARGYIQFRLAGQDEAARGGVDDANSIIFDAVQQPQFERLAKLIQRAVRESQKPVVIETAEESAAPPQLLTVGGGRIADRRRTDRRATPAEGVSLIEDAERAIALRSVRKNAPAPERTTAEARAAFVAQWASRRPGGAN